MDTWIRSGTIITPAQTLTHRVIIIHNDRISSIEREQEVTDNPQNVSTIDASGLYITPGLIDVHTHGAAGFDTMDATPQAIRAMADYFIRHGVTSFLATTITNSSQGIVSAIDNLRKLPKVGSGSQVLGVHLEGPYINSTHKGAQPEEWVRHPSPVEYCPWFDSGLVRLMTIAPELPGAVECIRQGTARGIKFSAGHSGASYSQAIAAIDAGLNHSTHTFNGMIAMNHRNPGVVGAVLTDERIYCEMIADGIHIHPAVLRLIVRIKGVERTILVTDSMRATGLSDGEYDLGGHKSIVKDGVVRTSSGSLAGSTLTLDRAVANMMTFGGCTINQAVEMATSSPANCLGLKGQIGVIIPGADADLLLADESFTIKTVLRKGKVSFQA